MFNAYNELT